MSHLPQPDKRIVTMTEYARIQAEGVQLGLAAACYLAFGLFTLVAGMGLVTIIPPIGILCVCGSLILFWFAHGAFRDTCSWRASSKSVLLLTRANTAHLPAPDSLVRASMEPRQEPQAVLLRAATEASERHKKQLVRASAGGTE